MTCPPADPGTRADKTGAASPVTYLDALKKLRVIVRAAQRHSAWIEKQCGVPGAQLWVMQELSEAPGMRVKEIAHKLAIHQTTASNLVDALERQGFIVKTRNADDHRAVAVNLSASGQELMKRAPVPGRGLLAEALSRLDETDLMRLDSGLASVLALIGPVDEASGMEPVPFMMRSGTEKKQA